MAGPGHPGRPSCFRGDFGLGPRGGRIGSAGGSFRLIQVRSGSFRFVRVRPSSFGAHSGPPVTSGVCQCPRLTGPGLAAGLSRPIPSYRGLIPPYSTLIRPLFRFVRCLFRLIRACAADGAGWRATAGMLRPACRRTGPGNRRLADKPGSTKASPSARCIQEYLRCPISEIRTLMGMLYFAYPAGRD